MIMVPLLCGVVVIACILFQQRMTDRFLQYLHDHYPDEWKRLGQPCGFWWRPEGRNRFEASLSSWRSTMPFLFLKQPEWINQDPDMLALWRNARTFLFITIVAGVIAGVTAILTPKQRTSEPTNTPYSSPASQVQKR